MVAWSDLGNAARKNNLRFPLWLGSCTDPWVLHPQVVESPGIDRRIHCAQILDFRRDERVLKQGDQVTIEGAILLFCACFLAGEQTHSPVQPDDLDEQRDDRGERRPSIPMSFPEYNARCREWARMEAMYVPFNGPSKLAYWG